MGGQIWPVTDTTDVVGVIKSMIAAEEEHLAPFKGFLKEYAK